MADLLHDDTPEQDEAAETPIDPGGFEVAMTAEDAIEADLLVSGLEEAGIPVLLQSPRSGPVGTIASPVESFNILVPSKQLARARGILAERRATLEADPEGAARAAEEEELATEKAAAVV